MKKLEYSKETFRYTQNGSHDYRAKKGYRFIRIIFNNGTWMCWDTLMNDFAPMLYLGLDRSNSTISIHVILARKAAPPTK